MATAYSFRSMREKCTRNPSKVIMNPIPAPTGVCWVPNFSGEILWKNRLTSKDGTKITLQDENLIISFDSKYVTISDNKGIIHSIIEPLDSKGLCLIHAPNGTLDIEDTTADESQFVSANVFWIMFKNLTSDCFEPCRCSAMDEIIPYNRVNPYDAIAKRFVTVLNNITDSAAYVKSPELARKYRLDDETILRTNILYFQKFIDLYHDEITNVDSYYSQIRCRKETSELLSHYNSEIRSMDESLETKKILQSINNTMNAVNTCTGHIDAYSEAICKSTISSRRYMLISITIAVVTVAVAIITSL